jgi:hypothetical protein
MKFFLCALGLAFILEGLPYFSVPHRMKSVLAKIYETPDLTLRAFGMIAIMTGLLLVYWGTGYWNE